MGTHRNTIELNGKTYDVSTGKPAHHKPAGHSANAKPAASPRVMDGFFRASPKTTKPAAHQVKPVVAAEPKHIAAPVKPKPAVSRPKAHHATHRKPQSSKTLLRQAVSKPIIEVPAANNTGQIKARTPENLRLKRASAVPKSRVITRFGNLSQPEPIPKKVAPLAVKQPPEHAGKHKQQSKPATMHKTHESSAEAHFKKALANAHAHEHHAAKKPRNRRIAHKLGLSRRGTKFATATLAALLLVGFFAYQNIPNISMRIAATRAGFSAQMPNHTPAGFGVSGPVQYGPGYVAVNFASRSDDQNFKVSQRVSSWNSEALADNFLNENGKQYQTYEDKGRTIYVYDGNNATWVNGGVWYQIEGTNNLKNDELISIASSM